METDFEKEKVNGSSYGSAARESFGERLSGAGSRAQEFGSSHAGDPVAEIAQYLRELQQYAGHYASAQRDKASAAMRGAMLGLVMAILAGLVGFSVILAAAFALLRGIAGGLAALFDSGPWLGQLVAGGVLLSLIGLGAFLVSRSMKKRWLSETKMRYEQRQAAERMEAGRSAVDVVRQERVRQGLEDGGAAIQ